MRKTDGQQQRQRAEQLRARIESLQETVLARDVFGEQRLFDRARHIAKRILQEMLWRAALGFRRQWLAAHPIDDVWVSVRRSTRSTTQPSANSTSTISATPISAARIYATVGLLSTGIS